MASPTDRTADVPAAGRPAPGAFWVPNPWQYPGNLNLSAFEPNRVYLNRGGMEFMDTTYLSGAGSDGDGRGALVADLDDDLQPDLIVRQAGGGPVKVYLNRFRKARRLTVSLEGTKSNRLGIGARIVAEAGSRTLARQLFPTNNFFAQQGARVRFGLGAAARVDRLTVHWPSGRVQVLTDIPIDRHIRVTEGAPRCALVGKKP